MKTFEEIMKERRKDEEYIRLVAEVLKKAENEGKTVKILSREDLKKNSS